jgi:hypothetical protein
MAPRSQSRKAIARACLIGIVPIALLCQAASAAALEVASVGAMLNPPSATATVGPVSISTSPADAGELLDGSVESPTPPGGLLHEASAPSVEASASTPTEQAGEVSVGTYSVSTKLSPPEKTRPADKAAPPTATQQQPSSARAVAAPGPGSAVPGADADSPAPSATGRVALGGGSAPAAQAAYGRYGSPAPSRHAPRGVVGGPGGTSRAGAVSTDGIVASAAAAAAAAAAGLAWVGGGAPANALGEGPRQAPAQSPVPIQREPRPPGALLGVGIPSSDLTLLLLIPLLVLALTVMDLLRSGSRHGPLDRYFKRAVAPGYTPTRRRGHIRIRR